MKNKMKKMRNPWRVTLLTGGLAMLAAMAVAGFYLVERAHAAALTSKSDTMSRLEDSVVSNHTIQFTTPSGVGATDATITVTFPAGFNLDSLVHGDIDITDDTTDLETATDCTGADEAGVDITGQVLTITICNGDGGDIAGGSVVAIEIGDHASHDGTGSNQIINHATPAEYEIQIGGTMDDSGDLKIRIIDDDSVNITAAVDESISFSISDVTIGFGTLTSANARYATSDAVGDTAPQIAHTVIAGTNATGGYTLTVDGATLTSGGDTIDEIGTTHAASAAGTEQFGFRASASGGIGASVDPYDDATQFAYFDTASPDQVASAAGASADTTYSFYYVANIASNTESGSYETDLTYIATATY